MCVNLLALKENLSNLEKKQDKVKKELGYDPLKVNCDSDSELNYSYGYYQGKIELLNDFIKNPFFKKLQDWLDKEKEKLEENMVHPEGLEPPTDCSEDSCSIH